MRFHPCPRIGCLLLAAASLAAPPLAVSPRAQSSAPGSAAFVSPARLELKPGDRVMLVGNTLAERQQLFNHFETELYALFPALDLTVHNLSRSGDTTTLQPRPLNFGDDTTHLTAQHADVMLLFFGLNESFDGEVGLAAFAKDLDAYLARHLEARYNGKTAPRLALVSPIAHEKLARLVHVDVEARNRELARYTETMRKVAGGRGVPFADVFTPMRQAMASAASPLTINGIHLNEAGDRVFAGILLQALGLATEPLPDAIIASRPFDELRELVRQKNQLFFYRFRPLNAEYVVGRRVDPFGSVNFPPEMKRLDEKVLEHEQRIWKQAKGLAGRKPDARSAQ
jgi:lysophospholipase L1-like esterase